MKYIMMAYAAPPVAATRNPKVIRAIGLDWSQHVFELTFGKQSSSHNPNTQIKSLAPDICQD